VVLRTQTPARRWKPTPQAWRICVTRLSGACSGGGAGMACTELATANEKASATILIIVSSTMDGRFSNAAIGPSLIHVNAVLCCRAARTQRCAREDFTMEMPTLAQVIVWIVVGLIGGSLAGFAMTWERRGFGVGRNVVVGLAGALVGGFLFRLFGLFPALDQVTISLRDIVAAFIGSLIIVAAYWVWQRSRQ
jgi:uncharacterized membrane protein YeaQ/YmgE (transglycosylase-associated protein family)